MEKKKFAYCNQCEKEISNPKRKPLDSMHYTIALLLVISSLGFAIIPLLVYYFYIRKKIYCPNCESILEFYSSPDKSPDPKKQINRVLKQIEVEKQERELVNKIEPQFFCPYCQKEISENADSCPNCGVNLKE
jgi:RNA polymerase-binding transcription factor DksA